ncbi:MAG: hypothetical protein A2V88_17715 [Elusimicrobia bacterium RBG_16_66_12]|nr:MAG: hypothetical protein A2V88_17715 [Elusimicrobia bacterium RBG_16_66_12]
MPPLIQNSMWAHNWTPGMRTPVLTIQTNPLAGAGTLWWNAATLSAWWDRGTLVNATLPIATVSWYDGDDVTGSIGYVCKADSVTISAANGGLVGVTMVFMAYGTTTPAAAPTFQTGAPHAWPLATVATTTGWSSFNLAFHNNCLVSPQAGNTIWPVQIDEGPPGGTFDEMIVPGGTAPSSPGTEKVTIAGVNFNLSLLRTEAQLTPGWSPLVRRHSFMLFAGASASGFGIS